MTFSYAKNITFACPAGQGWNAARLTMHLPEQAQALLRLFVSLLPALREKALHNRPGWVTLPDSSEEPSPSGKHHRLSISSLWHGV